MSRWREGWRRFAPRLRRNTRETRFDEEVRFHLDRQIEKHLRDGLAPDEARRQALIKFGGISRARERMRDQFRLARVEGVLRDVRYAARALRRVPGFTIAAVLTLALGIGATAAMFSIIDGVLLRPLPYPNQDRLVELVHAAPALGIGQLFASPAIYFTYRDDSRTFDAVGLWDWDNSPVTVTGPGEPESVQSLEVTHEVLPMLGANPAIGRGFTAEDDVPGSAPTVIISYGYWQRHFGTADPLGRTLIVDGVPRRVIGVLPASFRFFDYPADVFYPLQPVRSAAAFPSFDGRGIARLKPGVTLHEADADAARMLPILIREFERRPAPRFNAAFQPELRRLKDSVVGNLGNTLWLLMGTVGLLLLIACANVSNLLLVRTQARRPELAVRAALGAGRIAIARVVLTESVLLGLAGGIAGVAIAYWSLPLLLSLGAADLPQIMTVTIRPAVLLVAFATAVFAMLISGLFPIVHFSRAGFQLRDALHEGERSVTDGRQVNRMRHALLAAQVALAVVLLIGSGLMIRTVQSLQQVDPGFRDPGHVQTFQLTIPAAEARGTGRANPGAQNPEQAIRTKQQIVQRLAAVPGVESAAFVASNDGLPLDGDGRESSVVAEGKAIVGGVAPFAEIQFVSPGFFATLQTSLIAGRTVTWDDVYQHHRIALVSENLARAEWGSPSAALGTRIASTSAGPWSEVVGVIKDVHHNGLNQPAPWVVVYPAVPSDTAVFVVRSRRAGTSSFLTDLRKAVWSVDGHLSLAKIQTLGDLYRRSMARTSMTLQLLGIAGMLALLLGLIGVYGIVSYAVSQRRREIGIRLTLGAAQAAVRRMFVQRALAVVGIGIAIGVGAAAGLTRLMAAQLFGVSPLDPLTYVVVALTLAGSAALASYLSARRASALNPVEILKGE